MDSKTILGLHLSTDRFRMYNLFLAKKIGLTNAIFLQCLYSWIVYVENRPDYKGGDPYRTNEEFVEDTCLSLYQVKEAKRELVKLGLIKITIQGIPPTSYYSMDYDKVCELIGGDQLIGRNRPIDRSESTKRQVGIDLYTYNEINKKKKKDYSSLSFEHILSELDKTGTYFVSKKQLMRVLGYTENFAKKIEKELKAIKDLNERKIKLIQLIAGNKIEGKYGATLKVTKETIELPPHELDRLRLLAEYYESFIGIKIEITEKHIADYVESRRVYKFDQMEFVIKNCLKLASENSFYSRSFDQAIRIKNISTFVADPQLKIIETKE